MEAEGEKVVLNLREAVKVNEILVYAKMVAGSQDLRHEIHKVGLELNECVTVLKQKKDQQGRPS